MSKTILLMAGGTGGHIFPALAVGRTLQEKGWNLHWLGSKGGMEEALVKKNNIKISLLPVKGIRGKGFKSLLKAPFTIFSNVMVAKKIIQNVNPDVVLGMGGFASGPGGIAARLCGVPVVIHEQNAIAGMTNKLLHKVSKFTLQAYPGAFNNHDKVVTTGNPVRNDFLDIPAASERMNKVEGKINLLIVGGSLGAEIFNQKISPTLSIVNHGLFIDVKHQSGRGKLKQVQDAYGNCTNERVNYEVTEFIDDMAKAYAWADLVICRAGALTVAEVAMAGVCSIFVPYPHAVDDHQTHNARYLADQNAAVIIQQHDLTEQRLAEQITSLANDKSHLIEMAEISRELAMPKATEVVAGYCIEAANANDTENGNASTDKNLSNGASA